MTTVFTRLARSADAERTQGGAFRDRTGAIAATTLWFFAAVAQLAAVEPAAVDFRAGAAPLLGRHCLECHGAKPVRNDLNLARFTNQAQAQAEPLVWAKVLEQLEAKEMPPAKAATTISDGERAQLITWAKTLVETEALSRAGDPGPVKLRRLSKVEYDRTVRELTGVDLGLAKAFPADGAAGEGFTNTGEGMSMSPVLLAKYSDAAKQVARRAVLLPDGFRFSASDQSRDWTDEAIAAIRAFHARFANPAGELVVEPYIAATLRHRERLRADDKAIDDIAKAEKLNRRYLATLWKALNGPPSSWLLDDLKTTWRQAGPDGSKAITAFIDGWRNSVWKLCATGDMVGVGHFNPWQSPAPGPVLKETIRLVIKPGKEPRISVHLAAQTVGSERKATIRWERPRLETKGQETALLADLAKSDKARAAELPEQAPPPIDRSVTVSGAEFGIHPRSGQPLDPSSLASAAPGTIALEFPYAIGTPEGKPAPGERTFVVDALVEDGADPLSIIQPVVAREPAKSLRLAQPAPGLLLAGPQVVAGLNPFRELFPKAVLYAPIVPNDTTITLQLFCREDEPLVRLMLDGNERAELDRLWSHLRYISRDAESMYKSSEVWFGFTSQGGMNSREMIWAKQVIIPIREGAERFAKVLSESEPKHLESLIEVAAKAWRRPVENRERDDLIKLYRGLRQREQSHDAALRTCISRVLTSPAFLYRIEIPAAGTSPAPVDDWALASRLSYFLWAGPPDAELRTLAAAGTLHEDAVLAAQAKRMIADPRLRGLASEFGAAWLGVYGFDLRSDKSETVFPTFDAQLRASLYEETLRFIEDLFQQDRPLARSVDADWVFADERVAKHYGIPAKPAGWQRIEQASKFGRGGILALGSVLATQAGASRTSPILRGNWVVEHLLGTPLPRPPPNVPVLPETESSAGMSMREMITRHSQDPACSVCHRKIDPFGFSLEGYDAIGRLRAIGPKDPPLDLSATLPDGTRFTGIDGLRKHLLGPARERLARTFARKLLGYAIGRSIEISDRPLVEALTAQLLRDDVGVASIVLAIVSSPQFRTIRGRDVVAAAH